MLVPTINCYQRVLRLDVAGRVGTAFTIDRHGHQWLVTARHNVADCKADDIVVTGPNGRIDTPLEFVPTKHERADIQVYLPSEALTPSWPLEPSAHGVLLGQDAYFLGFPYGLNLKTSFGGEMPLVKKAAVSGTNSQPNGLRLWILDGLNNPGFSGGPVVFKPQSTKDWRVAAVVTSYWPQDVNVRGGVGYVSMNSGLLVGYDICHALDSIDSYADLL